MEPAGSKSCTSLKHSEENEIPENVGNIGVVTQTKETKKNIASKCLDNTNLVKTAKTREKIKSQFSVKSESYDDVFEKIASEFCEEIKRNRQDYRKKDEANIRIIGPKPGINKSQAYQDNNIFFVARILQKERFTVKATK